MFWGVDVCQRVRLNMTDGATQEYLAFLNSIVRNYECSNTCHNLKLCVSLFLLFSSFKHKVDAFPNSVHGLCYFHLEVQGWIKHVLPTVNKDGEEAKATAEHARLWIKSWCFDVETEGEYKLSKELFYKWLGEQQEETMSTACVEAIRLWILKCLEPYQNMWLNYKRLNVYGQGQRTTSIGEAMHSSMKSGASGVKASMNVNVAANCMMDNAERKGKEKAIHCADQVSRNKLWSESATRDHLTDFSEVESQEQWNAHTKCKVIEVEAGRCLVFTPGKLQSWPVQGMLLSFGH